MSQADLDPRLGELARRFTGSFPPGTPAWRTVGREAEFPVVDETGHAASVPAILGTLAARDPGLRVSREGELITGLHGADREYALEVGHGTVEVITGPADDLVLLEERHLAAQAAVVAAAAEHGARLLGLGIQPLSRATEALMSPKAHYQALLRSIGPGWLWFTVTASDQVHVDIGREELWPLANLGNLLAGLTVALTANSSVHPDVEAHGEAEVASARELLMATIGADACRHGMAAGPIDSTLDFVAQLAPQPFLLAWEEERKVANFNSFSEWTAERPGLAGDALWRQYLLHEHYVWHSARPRSNHATLELRSACQQPGEDSMAAAALGLGIVLAAAELEGILQEALGADPWPLMRAWHHRVARRGLAAEEPAPGLSRRLLEAMAAALADRGRGEERYLRPLQERAREGRNPAQAARELVAAEGVAALIEARALRS